MGFRKEHDSLGEKNIPEDAYYGTQTLRAVETYHITGVPISHNREFIDSLAYVKKACAKANFKLGLLSEEKCDAICRACDEIIAGKYHDQFIIDSVQGGAGTSTNMNANEVIANVALEIMGHKKGEYQYLHPNNDVNMSQSTNDAYPTAFRLALIFSMRKVINAVEYLSEAFEAKGEEFAHILKMGRTQLQDAVPMTLGQEFAAWATMLKEDVARLSEMKKHLKEINLGATAIGTGINTHPDYASLAVNNLAIESGVPVVLAENLVEATQDTGAYVHLSGVLKRYAVKVSKICNDLRLLASGPRCGLNEINLPPIAPGSSIMPGKINPVIPEVVNQSAYLVIGYDTTITMAAEAGQLELNVMEPVIAYALFSSFNAISEATMTLADNCVRGITANEEVCRNYVHNSIGIVTALVPHIGYEESASVAKESLKTGVSVLDIVLERKLLDKKELEEILKPEGMIAPTIH
jgi:aspartate ammonia-lyase